ncbi:MAG TPA: S8 family serine peptidase [Thermoanaerobaculia bacterium]|nr:S8 family serine peptidase [Thermoanaerobaculia bacterium]
MAFIAGFVLLWVAVAGVAAAEDYVLSASGKWKASHSAAVAAAGGTVTWSHGPSGLGAARSDNPNFLANLQAAGGFQATAADVMVEWQQPTPVEEAAVDASDDTFAPLQWSLLAVDAAGAWAAGCTGDGVRVAVIDGGIFDTHPDLDANVDTACSRSFVPGQPYNNDTGTFWHGTHVAGIVAAEDNTIGVVGIAPDATIIGVKVLHGGSGSFGAVIGGILYAADPGSFGGGSCARADIINMSLGAGFPKAGGAGSLIGALAKAVNFATSNGVLVISAAGNSGIDLGQAGSITFVPAESGSGLAVSATGPLAWAYGNTNFTRPASYSNYGEGTINVAGPGGDFAYPGNEDCTMPIVGGTITRPCWVFDMVLSTSRAGYSWAAGTSMASPAAAAVAALIVQANPGISLGALKSSLQQSADDEGKIGNDEFYGHGFVNAARACTE